jgi:hypothetical protein
MIKEYLTKRYFRSTMYSLKGVSRFSLDTSTLQFFKLDQFLISIANIFTTQKILKLIINIQAHFWSALNSLSENNKKFDFLNT